MILTTVLAAAAIGHSPVPQEAWELKSPLNAKYTATYAMKVEAGMGNETHSAAFNYVHVIEAGGEGKPWVGSVTWKNLVVDGNDEGQSMPAWPMKWNADGSLRESEGSDDDDLRRMLAPFSFVYPEKAVTKDERWESIVKTVVKGVPSITYKYQVLGNEVVDSKDTLKIKSEAAEKGTEGFESTGLWWIGKDGKVVKFELTINRWYVPFAAPERFTAKVEGKLKV